MAFLINSGRFGSAGPIDPATLSPLALWDAALGRFQTSGGSAATADTDPVGEWQDQSGNGHHVVQATALFRPILKTNIVNGEPVIRFDGATTILIKTSLALSDTGLSVVAVVSLASAGFYPHIVAYDNNGAGSWGLRYPAATGRPSFVDNQNNIGAGESSVGNPDGTTTDASGVGFQILEGYLDASDNWEIYQAGALCDTATNSFTMSATEDLCIGGRVSSLFLPGDIAFLFIRNSPLDVTEKSGVRSYLQARYAL